MGRRKRKRGLEVTDEEERWKDAATVSVDGSLSFQVVGIDSPTGTLFVRAIKSDSTMLHTEKLPALGVVLERVVDVARQEEKQVSNFSDATARELCRIGAIWISSRDERHSHNPPKWNRAIESQLEQEVLWEDDVVVRIHARPSRFPSFSELDIVSKNDMHGFWVVNKPCGCPSHATVDNGIENVLAVVQQQSPYATLPQRLDTETSGLLLVATRPDFARYMGQLLESKTTKEEPYKGIKPLTKKYRCLVVVSDKNNKIELYHQLCKWRESRHCVTHYLDTASPAPKTFVSKVPDNDDMTSSKKWQVCRLNITSVSQPYQVSIPVCGSSDAINAAERLGKALWGEQLPADDSPKYVLELEIDLLTGRTHQIRGQLSALGAPIVGDLLYGGVMDKPNHVLFNDARASNRMALQCCFLEFQKPPKESALSSEIADSGSSFYQFRLDHAWWTEYLHQYEKTKVS